MKDLFKTLLLFGVIAIVCIEAEKYDSAYLSQRESILSQATKFKYLNYTSLHLLLGVSASPGLEDKVIAVLPKNTEGNNVSLAYPFKAVYFPQVDVFSLMRVNGTRELVLLNATVRAWIEIGGQKSESKRMIVDDKIVGSRTIVITLNKGNITSIDWDDDCSTCTTSECLDGSCYLSASTLSPACDDPQALAADAFRCCIKIYVAWIGTDSNGRSMTSNGKIPSRFYKYSLVSSVYEAASGFWTDFVAAWSTPQD